MDMIRLARQILDPPLRDLPDLHLLDARPGQERIYFGVGARLAHFQEQARLLPIAEVPVISWPLQVATETAMPFFRASETFGAWASHS